jgi:hypothetical protein
MVNHHKQQRNAHNRKRAAQIAATVAASGPLHHLFLRAEHLAQLA